MPAIVLGALALAAIARNRAARPAWQAVAAVLMLGLAGYGLQGRPGLAGASKEAAETTGGNATALVAARREVTGGQVDSGNRWLMIADALASHGQFADAATVLQGAVRDDPKDAQAWLALANALVGHAEGQITPAALYAYQQAAAADPAQPGPPFFLGLALASSGKYEEARGVWSRLLAASPADAPWRGDLERRLAQIDLAIRHGSGTGQ